MAGSSLSSQPRRVIQGPAAFQSTVVTAAGDYSLTPGFNGSALTTANQPIRSFILREEDWQVYDKQTRLHLEYQMGANDVAANVDTYVTLFAVDHFTGSGTTGMLPVVTEIVAARSATVHTPAANTIGSWIVGPDFDFPADGLYIMALHCSAAFAANCQITVPHALSCVSI